MGVATMLRIATAVNWFAGITFLMLLVVQVVVVLLRYVFSYGVQWSADLLVYLFMIGAILPIWLAILQNHNVRVDVLYQNYRTSTKIKLDRLGLLFLLLPASAYTTWVAWGPMINSWQLLEASPTFGGLPGYFLLKTALVVMFAGLAVVALALLSRPSPWDYGPAQEDVSNDE